MTGDRRFVLPDLTRNAAAGAVVAGAIAAAVGVTLDPRHAWGLLLLNGFYITTLALAGMVFISLHYLSGAAWSANLRRIPEAMMAALPAAAGSMLILFFGRDFLYSGHASAAAIASPSRATYLSTPFFFGRMAVFVFVWIAFASWMRRASLRQDRDPDPVHHRSLVRCSAMFTVIFAVSFALASFDWLMTLTPQWTSTIFAVYTFAGLLVSGIAAVTLGTVLLLERGYLAGAIEEHHLHDLGNLLFAFSTFWAYIWFSQYLLIWYGNLPDETTYYISRTGDHWVGLFLLNLAVNWAMPFVVLMPWSSKHNPAVLKWIAIAVLAGRWLDLYLMVMPELIAAPSLGALDVLTVAGYAGVFFLAAARALARAPIAPRNDPLRDRSLILDSTEMARG